MFGKRPCLFEENVEKSRNITYNKNATMEGLGLASSNIWLQELDTGKKG